MPTLPVSPHHDFEQIKHFDLSGIEYWEARELVGLLGYKNWRDFKNTIDKAIISCKKSGQKPHYHFERISKMIKLAKGSAKEASREIEDYKLSRYGCYLIAQNGDARKREIALTQTYFAIQTRRQELFQNLDEQAKLFSTAADAGVTNFGKFNNMGYLGLFGKDDILDRAGSTELAANLFRITQTGDKIQRENIKGQGRASFAHYIVGAKVRHTIKELGGTMPEDLAPAAHINKLKPNQQKLLK